MTAIFRVRRRASTSGHGAAAQAAGSGLRRTRDRAGRIGDLAGWFIIGFALSVLVFNIWRAWRPMCQFIESPAFTAAPVPGPQAIGRMR